MAHFLLQVAGSPASPSPGRTHCPGVLPGTSGKQTSSCVGSVPPTAPPRDAAREERAGSVIHVGTQTPSAVPASYLEGEVFREGRWGPLQGCRGAGPGDGGALPPPAGSLPETHPERPGAAQSIWVQMPPLPHSCTLSPSSREGDMAVFCLRCVLPARSPSQPCSLVLATLAKRPMASRYHLRDGIATLQGGVAGRTWVFIHEYQFFSLERKHIPST